MDHPVEIEKSDVIIEFCGSIIHRFTFTFDSMIHGCEKNPQFQLFDVELPSFSDLIEGSTYENRSITISVRSKYIFYYPAQCANEESNKVKKYSKTSCTDNGYASRIPNIQLTESHRGFFDPKFFSSHQSRAQGVKIGVYKSKIS